MATLPEQIKIDDITSGRVDPQVIYAELEHLKSEINILRSDMSVFLKALATIPESQSQQVYYDNLLAKVLTIRLDIKGFCAQYNRLLPIINLTQIKLGHEVEVLSGLSNGTTNGKANVRLSVPRPHLIHALPEATNRTSKNTETHNKCL
ncbi:hypothetical protein METBIDRAFT_77445 [Metschnikowia bicuspidata var. bicuspidata NRRL YB-4993]|uniref:Uncharacterized protein n=1 Tax=Metschnikowia bicuspidata var. bicuspidata NRRL YB-4993 TaxID=869754 RepID=A0A1A0HDC9_9ASCO|nr:hypothetical protein METBIDRAFT_77445 [Metschnikowia bicuspidata var. bicuspidata NRRL YB-4993]OBA21902.1 hypothetical protein METBIDRAFT_77445 [Metschnikowia bicuspidata var. bicuspidata NRRL YB-4993]